MSERPSTEHLLVEVLLRSAEEVLVALAADPVDPALRSRAEVVLGLAFAPIWGRIASLTLDVTASSVGWNGSPVLDAAPSTGLLLPVLQASGIRSLTLVPGVERGEIQLFLAAVDRARRSGGRAGSDLATLLFRADLAHLRYAVGGPDAAVERKGWRDAPALAPSGAVALRDAVRREAVDERPGGVVRPEEFDSTLYFLDKREIEYLRAAIAAEYAGSPARAALALLFETLEARAEPEVRSEVLDVLGSLLPVLLGDGLFEEVTYLISEARRVSQAPDLDEQHKAALDRLRTVVSEGAALAQLFHALEDGRVQATSDGVGVLMRELRPDAVRQLLLFPEQMTNRAQAAAVAGALDAFFQEWPLALGRMLHGAERAVVHAALDVAARGKHPEFAELVAQAAGDRDPSTRARVAHTLATIGTARSFRLLSQMASDVDTEVRALVFGAFATRPNRSALPILESALSSPDLEQRSEREKRALFEAYGAAAGADGVDVLEATLRGRARAGQKPSSHTRACAALGLGRIGTPRARTVLGELSRDRDPVVRNAVSSALRDSA
jgi:HEAT repeat protein